MVIIKLYIFLDDALDFRFISKDLLPVTFPDAVATTITLASVNKTGPLIETTVISSNDDLIGISHHILFLLVDLKSNIYKAL